MVVIRVVITQQAAPAAPAPPSAPGRTIVDANEIRQQVRQTIIDAQQAAREAQQGAREAQAEARAAQAAHTLPGGVIVRTVGNNNDIPPQAVDISIAFFLMCAVIVIGWPIARAFGKRMERGASTTALPPAMSEQLQRIEQAVDAMSIEIERISESQRFIAKLQGGPSVERAALPLGERR